MFILFSFPGDKRQELYQNSVNRYYLRHAPLKYLPRNMPSLGNLPQEAVALIMLLSSCLDPGYLFQTKFFDQLFT